MKTSVWLGETRGYLQDWLTQVWVRTTGRLAAPDEYSWLHGPCGGTARIGESFIEKLAAEENLVIGTDLPGAGIFDSLDEIFSPDTGKLHPRIRDFYEHTSDYQLEVWSAWRGGFNLIGRVLSALFSRRLEQLNLPLRPLDTARGFRSRIIKLYEPGSEQARWTVWLRTSNDTGRVAFAGMYTHCVIPVERKKFFRLIFPLPNGSATVIMEPRITPEGNLELLSNGVKPGGSGFYFTLSDGEKFWIKFVRAMHEKLTVFVDTDGALRADHKFYFYGIRFLHLHYNMVRKDVVKGQLPV